MGIELVVLLVDVPSLESILKIPWDELYRGMEKASFRSMRPDPDIRLNRDFSIDCEAELLDWMDSIGNRKGMITHEVLNDIEDGATGLLHLMKWSSPGSWEVWEGRAFLYLDVALQRTIDGSEDLYSEDTWIEVFARLKGIPEEEFAERVCLDWMDRRKQLGETIDETKDPKIVPTYEAHDRSCRTLIHTINQSLTQPQLVPIVGREHLDAKHWGHGEWNLQRYLAK